MRQLLISSLVSSALVLSACTETSMSGGGYSSSASVAGKTAAERELEAQVRDLDKVTQNIVVQNTLQGIGFGALAGCGLGLLLSRDGNRDGDNCAKGAVAGGVAGGIVGNQVGQAAAEKKRELVQRDQVLANLKGVSAKLNDVEGKLQAVLKSQNAELASLKRQVAAKQVSQQAYDQRLNAINANRKAVDQGLAKSEANIVETRQEIKTASAQGQTGLSTVDQAAASTQQRLARNRKLIALAQ